MFEIQTDRLRLIALTQAQLRLLLDNVTALEQELGLSIVEDIVDSAVMRAINIKLEKMEHADPAAYAWYTYWLLVVIEGEIGVGLMGFKGVPDASGEVEIGYGITAEFRRQGYTTEAAQALIAWAFRHRECHSVVAPDTLKSNPASNRVLEKVGMAVYEETPDTLSWRIRKRSS